MVGPESTAFGRYRLQERLGYGGMAVVYRALAEEKEGGSRNVVIKRILETHSRDPHFVDMLISEARVSALLRHPAIVQMYELGAVEGEHYIAMEYVDGRNLTSIMRACAREQRHLLPGLACFLVKELASALGYAHALEDADGRPLRIVHRDVSPSNVMISRAGDVKLLDFGIAKAAEHFRDDHTSTGVLKGKISYMSPEQAEADPLDARSDIFSLGIVFWEALTTARLFRGETDLHSLRLIREAPLLAPSELVPWVDPDIDAVVLKMLARDPAARFASGEEVVQALSPIVERLHGDAGGLRDFVAGLSSVEARDLAAVGEPVLQVTAPSAGARRDTIVLVAGAAAYDDSPRTVTSSIGELAPTTASKLKPSPTRRWVVGGGIATGTALVLTMLVSRGPGHSTSQLAPSPAVAAVAAPPSPGPAAAEPAPAPSRAASPLRSTIHLQVSGDRGARVLLDGKPIGTLPLETDVRRRATATLLVTRPNHEPWRLGVALTNDLSVDVPHLLPVRAHVRNRPPTSAAPPPEMINPFRKK